MFLLIIYPILVIIILFLWSQFFSKNGRSSGNKISPMHYKTIPSPKGLVPIFGHLLQLKKNPHEKIKEWYEEHGNIFKIKFGSVDTIVLTEYPVIKEAFIENGPAFVQRFVRRSRTDLNKGVNLANSNGEYWKNLKTILLTEMTNSKLKRLEHYIQQEAEGVSDYFASVAKSGEIQDPANYIKLYSMNVILKFLFGIHYPYTVEGHSDHMLATIRRYFRSTGQPFPGDFIPLLYPFTKDKPKEYFQDYATIREFVSEIAKTRLDTMDMTLEPNNILDSLLIQHKKVGDIPLYGVIATCIDLVLAGSDTTGNSLLFIIIALCNNPEIQETLYEELVATFGVDQQVSYSDKSKTPYLCAIIKEAYRRFPAAPLSVPHYLDRDVEFRGYLLPKGSQVFQNVYSTHLSEKEWDRPMEFKPERFLEQQTSKPIIPFGLGSRSCVGMNLAENEIYILAATLFRKYKFMRPTSEKLSEDGIFGLALQSPDFKIKVEQR
ncbi:hypothetical protein CYY_005458 [Polysphondylium violaceum]|uniref:Cytochrome P450 family protein n=1 Tax=Polysphondylium violaceum TaxID=133409 RepID=A0A8J4US65_9MYCE|nr:hypothetical protein CYY_005458 [Polysphondylium violaceum]